MQEYRAYVAGSNVGCVIPDCVIFSTGYLFKHMQVDIQNFSIRITLLVKSVFIKASVANCVECTFQTFSLYTGRGKYNSLQFILN